jgi:serine/threonine-protein kinase
VSGGEVLVDVPLLRGKSTRDARFALERNGLKLGSIASDYSESFPENTVIDQTVAADRKIAKGSVVGITVSRGRSLQEITIPLVVGKTLAEAEKLLSAGGLKVGIVTYEPGFDLLPNTVVDQFPRAGEPGRPGQEVDLFVVKVGQPSGEFKPPQN